jgi:TetR/AcrR family transcriptional regulator, cholesterol catabolism regulator
VICRFFDQATDALALHAWSGKMAKPSNAMAAPGRSKRLGEKLFAALSGAANSWSFHSRKAAGAGVSQRRKTQWLVSLRATAFRGCFRQAGRVDAISARRLTVLATPIKVSNERSSSPSMALSLPNPRDTEAKLEHILRLSARIFAEKGFEGASIRDISRATGISLSGLYYYFDSKQKLLYLIQNNTFTFILARLRSRLAGAIEPVSRLRILVGNHIEYFLSQPHEMKVLSHEEEALDEPLAAEVAAIKRKYYGLARKVFDEVAAIGLAPGLNQRVAVLSLFGMMNWVYKWHNPEVDPGADELTDTIVRIFLCGVLSTEAAVNPALREKISQGAPVAVP